MLPENENMNEVTVTEEIVEEVPEVELTEELIEKLAEDETVESEVENVEPTVVTPETSRVLGKVKLGNRVFVREAANPTAKPLYLVNGGDPLYINLLASTEDYYRVTAGNGIGGFCEKKYVRV